MLAQDPIPGMVLAGTMFLMAMQRPSSSYKRGLLCISIIAFTYFLASYLCPLATYLASPPGTHMMVNLLRAIRIFLGIPVIILAYKNTPYQSSENEDTIETDTSSDPQTTSRDQDVNVGSAATQSSVPTVSPPISKPSDDDIRPNIVRNDYTSSNYTRPVTSEQNNSSRYPRHTVTKPPDANVRSNIVRNDYTSSTYTRPVTSEQNNSGRYPRHTPSDNINRPNIVRNDYTSYISSRPTVSERTRRYYTAAPSMDDLIAAKVHSPYQAQTIDTLDHHTNKVQTDARAHQTPTSCNPGHIGQQHASSAKTASINQSTNVTDTAQVAPKLDNQAPADALPDPDAARVQERQVYQSPAHQTVVELNSLSNASSTIDSTTAYPVTSPSGSIGPLSRPFQAHAEIPNQDTVKPAGSDHQATYITKPSPEVVGSGIPDLMPTLLDSARKVEPCAVRRPFVPPSCLTPKARNGSASKAVSWEPTTRVLVVDLESPVQLRSASLLQKDLAPEAAGCGANLQRTINRRKSMTKMERLVARKKRLFKRKSACKMLEQAFDCDKLVLSWHGRMDKATKVSQRFPRPRKIVGSLRSVDKGGPMDIDEGPIGAFFEQLGIESCPPLEFSDNSAMDIDSDDMMGCIHDFSQQSSFLACEDYEMQDTDQEMIFVNQEVEFGIGWSDEEDCERAYRNFMRDLVPDYLAGYNYPLFPPLSPSCGFYASPSVNAYPPPSQGLADGNDDDMCAPVNDYAIGQDSLSQSGSLDTVFGSMSLTDVEAFLRPDPPMQHNSASVFTGSGRMCDFFNEPSGQFVTSTPQVNLGVSQFPAVVSPVTMGNECSAPTDTASAFYGSGQNHEFSNAPSAQFASPPAQINFEVPQPPAVISPLIIGNKELAPDDNASASNGSGQNYDFFTEPSSQFAPPPPRSDFQLPKLSVTAAPLNMVNPCFARLTTADTSDDEENFRVALAMRQEDERRDEARDKAVDAATNQAQTSTVDKIRKASTGLFKPKTGASKLSLGHPAAANLVSRQKNRIVTRRPNSQHPTPTLAESPFGNRTSAKESSK